MIAPVFVDANVFVYGIDAGAGRKQQLAADWIGRLWSERLGRTSIQVLSEYYVTVTRKLRPAIAADEAWRDVNALMAWKPQAIDGELLQRAREVERRHRLSWWDAMIVAAAQLQDCALLLTEDLHDGGAYGSVTVRSPFTLSVEASRAVYTVAPRTELHRRRGRPRKVEQTASAR
jgi:predicted nucleic acid-binding protein